MVSVSRAVAGILALSGVLLTGSKTLAQKPPQLGYAYPPVVRAGEAAFVQLGGFDFTPDLEWFVHHEQASIEVLGPPGDYQLTPPPYWVGPRAGVAALPIPREVPARVTVPLLESEPAGPVFWQVANANGTSRTAVLLVSRGQEILESRSRDLPQRLPALPVAVSGRLSRLTEVDRYEFVAQHSGLVSVELWARRIGSGCNGVLEVRDASGRLLADLSDTQGLDGAVTLAVRAGETYLVSLHDVDFRGDRSFVYRLALTTGPRILATLPAAGERGTTRDVELVGYGLATGRPELESIRASVSFPPDPARPRHHHLLSTPFGQAEVAIPLSDHPEYVAEVPPGVRESFAITGRLPPALVEAAWVWEVGPDEEWHCAARSAGIGGDLDVALAIYDPQGNVVAENDDAADTTDAEAVFRAKVAGTYRGVVRSLANSSPLELPLFRCQVTRRRPGFELLVPQQIDLPLAGTTTVPIQVSREGGFLGPINVSIAGLPAGVAPEGDWVVPQGKTDLKGVLRAAAGAGVLASRIQFRGTATVGSEAIARTALAARAGNLAPRVPAEERLATSLLAVTMKPPFSIQLVDRTRQRDVPRGTACLAEMDITRQEGFAGEILLRMAAGQARYLCGSRGLDVTVPPGVSRVVYPAWMSEWLGTEFTIRMQTQGVALVPDPQGRPRYLVSPTDAPITMIMEGALLKLTVPASEIIAPAGEAFSIPVVVSRSAKLTLPTEVSLVVPEELVDLVAAEPLTLSPGESQGLLQIRAGKVPRQSGAWTFRLRATSLQEGKYPVISEAEIPVIWQ